MPMDTNLDSRRRAIVAAITLLNVALLPLFANMIAVGSSSWDFGRAHSFQLATLVVLAVVVLLRWKLRLGLWFNAAAALVAAALLFRSADPLAYLAYTGGLLALAILAYGLIHLLTGRRTAGSRSR